MTFKLHEYVSGDQHTLTATGDKGSGKTFILDKIAEAAPAWGFRVKVRSFFDENLTLAASRRAPRRVMPLIENSLRAWGFERAKTYAHTAGTVLTLQRRERANA